MKKPKVNVERLFEEVCLEGDIDLGGLTVKDVIEYLSKIIKNHPEAYFKKEYEGYGCAYSTHIVTDAFMESEEEHTLRLEKEKAALLEWELNRTLENKTKKELIAEVKTLRERFGND